PTWMPSSTGSPPARPGAGPPARGPPPRPCWEPPTDRMNVSQPFIQRPIATTLAMVGILGAGIIGYRQLAVSDLPTVDYPTITVNVSLPGASPETMASAVATPLEKQFSTIAGVDAITSTSLQGISNITIQFSLERSIDGAAQDVQA